MALNFSNTVVQRAGVYWEGILTGLFSIDFMKNLVTKCPFNSLIIYLSIQLISIDCPLMDSLSEQVNKKRKNGDSRQCIISTSFDKRN